MSDLTKLYNQDLNLWREGIKAAIQNKDVRNMDWDNLLEEIIDMGASEKRALRSYTRRLIEHILKLKFWESEQEWNKKGWEREVINFRQEITYILQDSPSLKNYLQNNYDDWLAKSIEAMNREFTIPQDTSLPLEIIMQNDYFGQ